MFFETKYNFQQKTTELRELSFVKGVFQIQLFKTEKIL